MAVVVPATGALLEQILDETFPLWGEGLSRAGYARYNLAQLRTPWGASHLHRVALVDETGWLATAKRYRLRARLDGQDLAMVGLGAVFTPARRRRQGHAGELIRRLLNEAASDGCRLALLFSEIEPGYYERFGFRPVPINQVVLAPHSGPGPFSHVAHEHEKRGQAPFRRVGPLAIPSRSGDLRDLAAIGEMNAAQAEGFRFTLLRDADYIGYAHAKKRLLAACGRPGQREVEFQVVEEGGRAAAYVVVLEVGSNWMVTECGDRDPSGARVGALLQSMLSQPGRRPAQVHAWLPPNFLPPQLTVLRRDLPSVSMMLAPIGGFDAGPPLTAGDLAWWHGDAF